MRWHQWMFISSLWWGFWLLVWWISSIYHHLYQYRFRVLHSECNIQLLTTEVTREHDHLMLWPIRIKSVHMNAAAISKALDTILRLKHVSTQLMIIAGKVFPEFHSKPKTSSDIPAKVLSWKSKLWWTRSLWLWEWNLCNWTRIGQIPLSMQMQKRIY